jgi:hypothetical protein
LATRFGQVGLFSPEEKERQMGRNLSGSPRSRYKLGFIATTALLSVCSARTHAQTPAGTVTLPAADDPFSTTSFRYDTGGTLYANGGVNVYQQNSGGTFSVIGTLPAGNDSDAGPINFSNDNSQILIGNGAGGSTPADNGLLFALPKTGGTTNASVGTVPYNYDIVPVPASVPLVDSNRSYFVDAGNASFTGSTVSLFDSRTGSNTNVLNIPGASASITIDPSGKELYAESGFGTDAGQIRSFSLTDLTAAYNSGTPLDFDSGKLFNPDVGDQSGSGLFFDKDGYLFAGGADGFTVFRPDGSISDQLSDPFSYTTIGYNPVADEILAVPYGDSAGTLYNAVDFETVTPEPASIAILGVGGLILLRRKARVVRKLAIAAAVCLSVSVAADAMAGPYQLAGPYATNPSLGALPIPLASSSITEWASAATVVRGLRNVEDPTEYSSNANSPLNYAFYGGSDGASAAASAASIAAGGNPIASTANTAPIGMPSSSSSSYAVALGQTGSVTLTFPQPIINGPGTDFAVFGNGFSSGSSLEWVKPGLVSVSSDGVNFFPFPAISLTPSPSSNPSGPQVSSYGELDPTNLYDIAGKDPAGYGTPFDLSEVAADPGLNVNDIIAIRITSVTGDTNTAFASLDSAGNVINSPWPAAATAGSEGFDLAGVGVINETPEPSATLMLGASIGYMVLSRHCRMPAKAAS